MEQRREQISRANRLVGGRPINFPPLPAVDGLGVHDRLHSNSKASTSQQAQPSQEYSRVSKSPTSRKPYIQCADPDFDIRPAFTYKEQANGQLVLGDTHSMATAEETPIQSGIAILPTASILKVSCKVPAEV